MCRISLFLGLSTISLYVCRARLPRWLRSKESACQCRRCGFDPWPRKTPWRSKWPPTPVFLPGKSHGQRSLVACRSQRAGHTSRLNNSRIEQISLTRLSAAGRLGCFRFLVIVVIAAVNTGVHVPLNTFQCLSVCIQEWKCSLTLILCAFLRSCHPVSTALHHVACSPPACKGPVSSHPHQLGLLFLFLVIVAR